MPRNTTLRLVGGTRITVIGTGCAGLATAAVLARLGHAVHAVGADADVERLNEGIVPIWEEGIDELVRDGLATGTLHFTADLAAAVGRAEMVVVCLAADVGVPADDDLAAVVTVVGAHLPSRSVLVLRSPVTVGAAARVWRTIERSDVGLVVNPALQREGFAVRDVLHPDRVVIGSDQRWAADAVARAYSAIESPLYVMSAVSAELVEQAASAMLALKATFANEVAELCEALGADAPSVLKGVGGDARIGPHHLRPGPGWGGAVLAGGAGELVALGRSSGRPLRLLDAAHTSNDEHVGRVADRLRRLLGHRSGHIAVWGLSYRGDTQDVHRGPAMRVLALVDDLARRVTAYDPAVERMAILPRIQLVDDPYDALDGADALFIANEWPVFAHLDLDRMRTRMRVARILDSCNLLDPRAARAAGFDVIGVGRAGRPTASGLSGLAAAD